MAFREVDCSTPGVVVVTQADRRHSAEETRTSPGGSYALDI